MPFVMLNDGINENAPQLLQIVFNKTASKKARLNKSLQYCCQINVKAKHGFMCCLKDS